MIIRVLILLFLSLVLSNAVSAGKPATMQSPSVYAGNQRIGQYLFTDYSANKIRVMSDNGYFFTIYNNPQEEQTFLSIPSLGYESNDCSGTAFFANQKMLIFTATKPSNGIVVNKGDGNLVYIPQGAISEVRDFYSVSWLDQFGVVHCDEYLEEPLSMEAYETLENDVRVTGVPNHLGGEITIGY